MKNIIVLPGTQWQIPLIKRINKKGYNSICLNLYKDSPAFEYANKREIVDILDIEACKKIIEYYNPVAIMSEECDIAMVPIATLSNHFGLNSISIEHAMLYTNKYLMRKFGREHGYDTPGFCKCETIEQAIDFYHSHNNNNKMILKPLDANSSRGVFSVNCEKDIENYFELAKSFSKAETAALLEEYIDGTEFTVDGIKTKEGHTSLAISKKKHYAFNENIARQLYFSYYDDEYDYDILRNINDDFVNESGLEFGLTHAEYKYKDGKFYLIEIGARGGGNLISSHIVPLLSGVDTYEYLIEKTLGHECNETVVVDSTLKERCAVLDFFDVGDKEGVLKDIQGVDFLEGHMNIIKYGFNFKAGDYVGKAENDSRRLGYYIAYGEDKKELSHIMNNISRHVKYII